MNNLGTPGSRNPFKSRLENCIIIPRACDNESIFLVIGEDIFCNLTGYAIIPCEEYEELKRKVDQIENKEVS